MSIYSKVPVRKPNRNVHNLTHTYYCSANIGELVPIARPMEAVPGDTFITGNISEVELNPIVTNFKGELYFETWQFFVSNDMLYNTNDNGKFTDILASMQNPQSILSLPYISNITYNNPRSTMSYLTGLPSNKSPNGLNIVAYITRAYSKIVNEWFRDENLENEYLPTAFINSFYHLNYKKDRYSSAFLTPQKGNPVTLKSVFSPSNSQGILTPTSVNPTYNITGLTVDGQTGEIAGIGTNISTSSILSRNIEFNKLMADYLNSQFVGFTINDLRLANKLQKWQERNQLCGTRIKEYLLANYGITPDDETLQRPVLIGHTKVPVIVNEVIANIKNTNASGQTYQNEQGSRGGVASASSSFRYGKWLCKEFGWIITLGSLRPKAVYTGGIHKSLTKDSVIDYFNPIFEHLGQQVIQNKELFISGTNSTDNGPFGYQDIYNEMRHLEDYITEDLLTAGFQTKHIFRSFAATPTLTRNFIEVKPTDYDYLFAVPSTTAPQAFITSNNIIKAVRPISKRSTPSL